MAETADTEVDLEGPRTMSLSSAPRSTWLSRLRGSKALLRLVSLVVVFGAWEVFGRLDRTHLFPPISRVAVAFWTILVDGRLLRALAVSLQSLAIGFGLAIVMGLLVGFLMARSRPVERIFSPYLDILLAAPAIAFIPLFVIALGLGLPSRAGVVFIFSFPFVAINTYTGIRGVDPLLVEMGQAFCLGENQLFWKIVLPAAVPLIMAGFRLGAGRAFIGMVASDILLVSVGVGGLIQFFNATFRTAYLFATVLAVLLLAVALTQLTRIAERRLSFRP